MSRQWSRRAVFGVLALGGAAAAAACRQVAPSGPEESTRERTIGFTVHDRRFGDDRRGQIAGYASATSVAPGETLDFHVSVSPAADYRIEVYRVGHYGGRGERLLAASPWLAGRTQAEPSVDPKTRMVRCAWERGWRLRVGPDWVSGFYLALLTNADGWCRWVPFVVRDTRPAAGLVIVPTSTYQAYNMWPHDGRLGASLYYGFDATGEPVATLRSRSVSHDRPYQDDGLPALAEHDMGFVRWAEEHGADLGYATSEDLDSGRVDPGRHRAVIFCGHDEYWTTAMRRAVATARDHGTSLVFLSANNCYWRVRYGTPDRRTVNCTKVNPRPGKPVPLMTRWRAAGSPEQELIGAQYVSVIDGRAPLVVRDSRHWFWAGTGVRDGDAIPNVVSGEADQRMPDVRLPTSTEDVTLARSPYQRKGVRHEQHTTLYRAPSGAWVFAAGSLGWTAALPTDARIQRATRNLLDRVLE
ncbi:N,N-dimethylformamidase beta subunit family domain-containing protein [Asanoa iriomotensis]|uniref:N,N-dimethylformamidase beta subunit-like C-terminal domain-containing protein n=1 Tax=Asanoa iriomotensis TaxID=234613 RepID=A0ABQ4C077_9ACTN|nr:N,N-dimethylformamidase beta subunit family domain-containing protein [Asanoa iriomotensis]GIF55826.1 hypothetical protein Air01nite_19210 [Asanoa iriomotensis]